MNRLSLFLRSLTAGISLAAATLAHSGPVPSGPIRIVVPYSPGGPPDAHARYIAERLQSELKEIFIVENRPGAGGTIAMEELAKSPADGRTLALLAAPQSLAPIMYPNFKVSLDRDIEPVAQLAWQYNVLVVPSSSGIRSIEELVARLKSKPGHGSFASGGVGTPAHLLAEVFKRKTALEAVHVPYNNFGQAISDTIGGQVDFMFMASTAAMGHVASGRLRALAVAAPNPLPAIPGVKTMAELGYSEVALSGWTGIFVKAGTDPALTRLLSDTITRIMAKDHAKTALAALGDLPAPVPQDKFKAFFTTDGRHWSMLARSLAIKPN